MTSIKRQAVEKARQLLEYEQRRIDSKLYGNKRDMRKLVEEQSVLKRERKVICDLIWELDGKPKRGAT